MLFFIPLVAFLSSALAAEPVRTLETVQPLPRERATIELHAHLFMKEGMTWAFKGDFDAPLQAKDWKSRFSTQANPETLDASELGIVVVALYAHPLFTLSLRDSIRRQISLAEKFVESHPNWIIARSPAEARAALSQGKRALIFSLEGADGVIENEEDLREFVDEKGIRIVTLLHLTDDQYGGVAFLRGIRALASPWAWISQLLKPHIEDGHRLNANGLSAKGRAMTRSLMKRGVWLDLSHASDLAQKDLIAMQTAEKLPLLYTHTSLRKYLGAERGISAWQLAEVKKSGGVIGLMPSEEMLVGTASRCEGGVHALATQYSELVATVGADSVAMGSDYNGGIPHLHPSSCPVGTGLDQSGLWNIGQVPEVWTSLEKLRAPVPRPRRKIIEHFLKTWERIRPPAHNQSCALKIHPIIA